nr:MULTISPECIES: hypothetical protein [Pseudofrankia]
MPIRAFGYVRGANAQIAEMTGAPFGEAYELLIADGSFVMDSEAAARGVAALRRVAPTVLWNWPSRCSTPFTSTV